MRSECDYLVIGSGVAGLTFALEAAKHGRVAVLTKRRIDDSNTNWAQGGIAAVMDPTHDSFEAHVGDTLRVGYGLSKPEIVEMIVRDGPDRIRDLIALGAGFDSKPGLDALGHAELDLTREGGHTARRVVHSADSTGREVQRVLVAAVRRHPNIEIHEQHMAIDLIEQSKLGGPHLVTGCYALDHVSGSITTFASRVTVLASGGAGKVYLYTTNPDVATGDGVAMAYRAGALIGNMEFFQFHPTCLYHPAAKSFLISEALRGEGGILRLGDGEPFMKRHHEMADLAPRDVVARAIDYEMKRTGAEHVTLDMTHKDPAYLRERFPSIYEACLEFGIDMATEPIPVVPAAHYMCGGVVVDDQGRTSVPGLWAVGEVACSGLHGANRLASNSLLEGLVYGQRAAAALAQVRSSVPIADVPEWDFGEAAPSDEAVVVTQNWDEIRRFMWNYVGIVRSDRRLRRAARRVALLKDEIREYYWQHLVTLDLLELRNIADVAETIIACAALRRESRGLHFNIDHRDTDPAQARDSLIVQGEPPHYSGG